MVYSQWTDGVSGKITFIIYMIIPLSQWKDHKNVHTLIPLTQWNQPLPYHNNASQKTFCDQLLAVQAMPHTFDQGISFVIVTTTDQLIPTHLWTSPLIWASPFPWIIIYVELGMRIM